MKSFSSEIENKHVVEVNWADRWQVYQRLKELDIPCSCASNQPLQVEISSATAVVQLWSVIRRFSASRQDQIWTLESCWKSRYQKF
ncbi:Asr1405/Asl0597 family protein [Nostoc sp. C117]|uniref:Asr1405/Asl0597 family protein n=1 Tax=Nostoc sp. C117 TaxID=3349875 RepID=UPI00370DA72F